jgi:uncharacterized protein (DUF1778 family)
VLRANPALTVRLKSRRFGIRHDNVWQTWHTLFESSMATRSARTVKLDLRLSAGAKQTLRAAATAENRSISDFVLESALARADETLADRHHFGLDAAGWKAFHAALDAPVRELPRLRQLLSKRSVFER